MTLFQMALASLKWIFKGSLALVIRNDVVTNSDEKKVSERFYHGYENGYHAFSAFASPQTSNVDGNPTVWWEEA